MIYTCVLHSSTIISEYSEEIGDFKTMIKKIYNANRQPIEFYVIPYLNFDFYFLNEKLYTFSCITNNNEENEKVLIYLQNIKKEIFKLLKNKNENFTIGSCNIIRKYMNEYKINNSDSKILNINKKLQNIIQEKQNQLEEAMENDTLLNKMSQKSIDLKNNSYNLNWVTQKKFKKRRYKKYIIFILILLIIFFIIYIYHNERIKNFINKYLKINFKNHKKI